MINILISVLNNVKKVMFKKINIAFLLKINLKNKIYILIVVINNIFKMLNVLKNVNIISIKTKLIRFVQHKNHVMKLLINQL